MVLSEAPELNIAGKKHDADKIGTHLLPPGPLLEIAKVLDFGAKKYDSWNWAKGIKWTRLYGAILRHLWAWFTGETLDPETGLNHLAHVGCSVLFLLHYAKNHPELDDRPVRELGYGYTGT